MLVKKVTLFAVAVIALFAFAACDRSPDKAEELSLSEKTESAQNSTQSDSSNSLATEDSANQSVEKKKSEARSGQITKSEEKQEKNDEIVRKRSHLSDEGLQVKIDGKKVDKNLEKKIIVKARNGLTLSDALQDTNLIEMEEKKNDQKTITSVAGVKGDWEIKVNGKVVTDLELDITLQSGDQIELLLNK